MNTWKETAIFIAGILGSIILVVLIVIFGRAIYGWKHPEYGGVIPALKGTSPHSFSGKFRSTRK